MPFEDDSDDHKEALLLHRNALKIATYCFTLVLRSEESSAGEHDSGKGAVTSPVLHPSLYFYIVVMINSSHKAAKGRGKKKGANASNSSPWADETEKEKNLAALVGVLELDLGALWSLETPEDEFSQVSYALSFIYFFSF